jgi:large subunit ribosomal protein L23
MEILKKPVVTEKYTELGTKHNQFAFIVDKHANKKQIRAEIEKVYEVEVDEVRTMVYAGKTKTRMTKKSAIQGRKSGYKKAIITLKKGSSIDFYSNI